MGPDKPRWPIRSRPHAQLCPYVRPAERGHALRSRTSRPQQGQGRRSQRRRSPVRPPAPRQRITLYAARQVPYYGATDVGHPVLRPSDRPPRVRRRACRRTRTAGRLVGRHLVVHRRPNRQRKARYPATRDDQDSRSAAGVGCGPAAYYLDVIGRALQTADATQLESLSDAGCQGCQNFIGAVKGSKEAREVTRGGEFTVLSAASPPLVDGGVVVQFRYERAAATVVDEFSAVTAKLPPDPPLDAQMRLLRRPGGWIVLGFRATPVSP